VTLTLIQFSYTPETLAKLVQHPEDRSIVVKKLIEQSGGRMLEFYYAFGEFDGVIIAEMPDHVASLASTFSAYSQGGLTNLKTTILVSVEEAMKAMKIASGLTMSQPEG
jgi:uncharacterized protein with GYD domain